MPFYSIKLNKSILLGALCLTVAILTRFPGLGQGLPDVIHPDEQIVIHRALYFASGDLNPHIFNYPSLSMYTTAGFLGVGTISLYLRRRIHSLSVSEAKGFFIQDPTFFYYIARLGNAMYGVVLVGVLYVWGMRFIGQSAAAWVAWLVAIHPNLVSQSYFDRPDALMTLLGVLSFLATCQAVEQQSMKWLMVSAALAGLASSTKYNALPFLIPFLIAWIRLFKESHNPLNQLFKEGVLLGVLFFVSFILGTPFALFDFSTFWTQVRSLLTFTHHGPLESVRVHVGHNVWNLLGGLGGSTRLLGWVWSVLFIVTLPFQNRYGRLAASCFGGFLLMVAIQTLSYGYYLDPALPLFFFAILASDVNREYRSSLISLGGRFIIVLLSIPLLILSVKHIHQRKLPESRQAAKFWLIKNCSDGAKILTDAGGPTLPLVKPALQQLLQQTEMIHHPRAAFFQLQLDYYNPTQKHFNVYLSSQAVMMTPPEILRHARLAQRLQPIDWGLDPILRSGFQYIVVAETEEAIYRIGNRAGDVYPKFRTFYHSLNGHPEVRLVYDTQNEKVEGPRIRIYQLARNSCLPQ